MPPPQKQQFDKFNYRKVKNCYPPQKVHKNFTGYDILVRQNANEFAAFKPTRTGKKRVGVVIAVESAPAENIAQAVGFFVYIWIVYALGQYGLIQAIYRNS